MGEQIVIGMHREGKVPFFWVCLFGLYALKKLEDSTANLLDAFCLESSKWSTLRIKCSEVQTWAFGFVFSKDPASCMFKYSLCVKWRDTSSIINQAANQINSCAAGFCEVIINLSSDALGRLHQAISWKITFVADIIVCYFLPDKELSVRKMCMLKPSMVITENCRGNIRFVILFFIHQWGEIIEATRGRRTSSLVILNSGPSNETQCHKIQYRQDGSTFSCNELMKFTATRCGNGY